VGAPRTAGGWRGWSLLPGWPLWLRACRPARAANSGPVRAGRGAASPRATSAGGRRRATRRRRGKQAGVSGRQEDKGAAKGNDGGEGDGAAVRAARRGRAGVEGEGKDDAEVAMGERGRGDGVADAEVVGIVGIEVS